MTQTQRLDVRELINRNPLSRFQKLIIFLGFCVIALDGFDIAIMGFIAPTLKLEWGVSNHQLGLVISAALIGLALGAIFSGPLADWLGRKKIIINSVFFFGFWTIATAFSHNVEQMMFFRFMTGLGLGAAMPNIGTLVSEYAPERQRSFIITVIFCGFTFGAAAGGFSASWLIPQFGWHSLMALGGILPLLFAPLLIWLLPESVRFLVIKQAPAARIRAILNRLYPGQISDNVRFILPAQPAAGNAMRIVLSRQYGFGSLMLWLVYFMGLFLVYILGSWLPTLVKAVGMTVSQAAIMTAIYQAGGTLGSLFAGWLMDRINPHRALGIIYAVGGLFTMAMGYAAGSFALLCMLAFISGACLNGANTGMNALSARYYPTQARAAAAGGFSASWLIPQFGWHSLMALGGILPLLFAPLLIWLLPESVRFLVIKQAPAARILAILNRLYPGQISDNVTFILPAQPAAGNAMRIVLSRQYGFGSLMLWLVYFMGLFLVYILGSWLPTLVKAVGMTVSQAAIMTAIYQAGGTLGSLFAGWLMDRINPHRALGIIYAVGGLFTMAMGYAAGSFALLCMLAFISGACLNGANTGMNALSARYYPTQARATGSSWMHGVGRIGAILSAFAGAEMMALNLPFESVFLILGIPAALTVAGLAAKGIFAAGHPPVASTSPASVRGAS
ncbi:4-hydroxybenzoate transporter [Klebsiella pneumoniae]|nr:4-hydroxybenzoate transporter [Klebsiella pneumoniae]